MPNQLILRIGLLSFAVTIGVLLGRLENNVKLAKDVPNAAKAETSATSIQPIVNTPTKEKAITHFSQTLLAEKIRNPDASVRLDGLYQIWKFALISKLHAPIVNLANNDSDLKVKRFARWIIDAEQPQALSANHTGNEVKYDLTNVDELLQLTLHEAEETIAQENDLLVTDVDLIEPLYALTVDEQLNYIKQLVESNEDAAIAALNDLILYDDSTIQKASIDGLISVLEQNTGHYPVIIDILTQNSVFLDEEQTAKVQRITSAVTANQPRH